MGPVDLIPSYGGVIYTVLAFIVALSIIVAVHEFGHYIVGRWSGIRAEVFSIGFGPALFSRVDRRGTRWQVSALPFGGYVRFLGDSDAASGKDGDALAGLNETERRQTMHGAPLWARTLTVAAGPVFNFIFSILVFAALFAVAGVATKTPTVGKLRALPGALVHNLKPGDTILAVNGRATPDTAVFGEVVAALKPQSPVDYRIRRGGKVMDVQGPFPLPAVVGAVQPNSAAYDAGLMRDDVITAIDGKSVNAFEELRKAVTDSKGKALQLTVWQQGQSRTLTLKPRRVDLPTASGQFETRWLIGVTGGLFFDPTTRTPGIFEAVNRAAAQTGFIITTSLNGLYQMVTGAISSCNLRGPIGIAETSGAAASQGFSSFVSFIAMLSTAVGLLNLFPVPVLDGGHLVFYAWEAVAGRPPSDRALKYLMGGGLMLILALMAFAISNDLFCP